MTRDNPDDAAAAHDLRPEATFASLLLRQRRRREALIGDHYFSDPAWDIMLDLFVAHVRGSSVATSSLVIASGVPHSTALRRIRDLVRGGELIARADPLDGRRTFVALSDDLLAKLALLLREWRTASEALRSND